MDKKGVIKASILGLGVFFLVLIIILIFNSLTTKAEVVKNKYNLGEKVKIDLQEITNYKVKIITPSQTFIKQGSNDVVVFKASELGKYKVILSYNGKTEEYGFEVVDKTNDIHNANISESITANEISELNQTNASSVIIDNSGNIHSKEIKEEGSRIKFKISPNSIGSAELRLNKREGNKNVEVKRKIPLEWKIKNSDKIRLYWEEGNKEVNVNSEDLNNDGYIDEINWTIGDLAIEQTFSIIIITKAEHLDSNRTFISDIYDSVKELDGNWSEDINDSEYVRVKFEKNLTKENDITLFPRVVSGAPKIEVYEANSDVKIAEFISLNENHYNKVFLSNLIGEQNSFDLRVVGGAVQIDHIIDPMTSGFTDGASVAINQNAGAPSTVATLATSFPAGDNLLIAAVQISSSDTGSENIPAGGLILRRNGGATVASNEYLIQVSTTNFNDNYLFVARDVGAGANQQYDLTAYSTATVVNVEAKLAAISGVQLQAATDTGSVALTAGSDTTVGTVATSFTAGANVIIASVQIDSNAAQDIAAGNIKLKDGDGTVLASNQFAISFSAAASTDIFNVPLLYYDTAGKASETYNVTVNSPGAANAEAKIIVFRPVGAEFSDGGSVALPAATKTSLTSITTAFPANSELLVVTSVQTDDTDTNVETMAAGSGLRLEEDGVLRSVNQNLFSAFAASGAAGDGSRHTLIYRKTPSVASSVWDLSGNANAAGLNGEGKMLILELTDLVPPNYTLNSPINGLNSSVNYFIFNATIGENFNLTNVSLWANFSGTYQINQTNSSGAIGDYLFNVTNIPEGRYIWAVQACDSSNNCNISSNRTLTVDTTFPLIDYGNNNDADGANVSRNNIYVNVTVTETNEINITFNLYNTTGQVNSTTYMTAVRTINWTNLPDERYTYNVSVTDIVNHINTTATRTTTLDTVNPFVNITYPLMNINYSYNVGALNYTASDINLLACWYSLNNGQTNTTITCGNNVTGITSIEGANSWRIYANDAAGNLNFTIVNFTIRTPPNFTIMMQNGTILNYTINSTESGVFYNVEVTLYGENASKIYFYNLNTSGNQSFIFSSQTNETFGIKSFAISTEGMLFDSMNITLNASATHLYKCLDWNMTSLTCNNIDSWDVVSVNNLSQLYNLTLNSTDPGFVELSIADVDIMKDGYVSEAAVGTEYGARTVMVAMNTSGSNMHPLINFNLTKIPSGVVIDGANLTLRCSAETLEASESIGVGVHLVYSNFSWSEGTGGNGGNSCTGDEYCWNNKPMVDIQYNSTNESSLQIPDGCAGINYTFVVANSLRYAYSNNYNNVSFLLKPTGINVGTVTNDEVRFNTKEVATASFRPKLNITYHSVPKVSVVVPSAGSNFNYSSNVNITINATDVLVNISSALANITFPNGANQLFNMSNLTSQIYSLNFSNSSILGRYNVTFIVNNTDNYVNNTVTTYFNVVDVVYPLISYGVGTENDGTNFSRNWIYANVSVTEDYFSNITFTLKNDSSIVNSTTYTTQTFFINWTNLQNGNYSYNVSIRDTSNNFNSTLSRKIIIDNILPSISLVFPVNNTNLTTSSANFTWNVTDNLNYPIYCNLTLDGIVNVSNIVSNNGINTSSFVMGLADGTHYWNVTCRDLVNVNTSITKQFTIYTTSGTTQMNISLDNDNYSIIIRWSNVTTATSYNIYITANYSAGFPSTPNYTGVTTLNFTDNNANSSLRRFYKIGAVNGPAENISDIVVGKIQPDQMFNSFNLLSWPLNLTNYVLNNGANNGYNPPTQPINCIQSLYRYNGSKFQETTNDGGVWTPAIGDSDFTSLEPLKSYWFETNSSCNVTFLGEVPRFNVTTSLNLTFNLIGWNSAYHARLGEEASLGNPLYVVPTDSFDNIFRYNVSKATSNPQLTGFQGMHHFSGYGWWPFYGDEDFDKVIYGEGYYVEITSSQVNWTHNPNFNN